MDYVIMALRTDPPLFFDESAGGRFGYLDGATRYRTFEVAQESNRWINGDILTYDEADHENKLGENRLLFNHRRVKGRNNKGSD